MRAGMQIAEARARCATLDVRPWDAAAIDDAILAATTALLAASPQVTPVLGTPGLWWVGATGFHAMGGEAQLVDTLLTIARAWHPQARVAIADACVTARAATWAPRTTPALIIPHGHDAAYLAPAPLGLLPMEPDVREALHALGIRSIGAFAALSAGDVEQRWGPEGLGAWRLAHGEDPRRPGHVRVEAPRQASVELPQPVDRAEPILFVLRAQLERLLAECVHDGRAAASVAITLTLDAGRSYPIEGVPEQTRTTDLLAVPQRSITREVRPARPLARLTPLFDQCRLLLDTWQIPAPIIGVTVSIPATAPLTADQGDLLQPSWRDAAMQVEQVFARLRVALDPTQRGDVLVCAEPQDTHRPEERGRWSAADAIPMAAAPTPAAPAPASTRDDATVTPVLRLLPAPEPIDVEGPAAATRGPQAVWWHGRRIALTVVQGPERLSGDWWRGDGYARDYWRGLSDTDGELLLFHDASGAWYLQGWYD